MSLTVGRMLELRKTAHCIIHVVQVHSSGCLNLNGGAVEVRLARPEHGAR